MRKLLFIIAVLLSFGAKAQTFTPIHNYQAPDGLDVVKFFGIPHGETPTLNGVNRPGGHPLFYNTTDSSLYLYSGSQWIRVGGGNGNKDTVLVDEGLGVRFDSLGYQHIFALHADGYEGGVVTYTGTGFDFNVSPITLYLNNKVFQFPSTTLTLSPPNSQPRYDIFGVDSLGAFVKSGDSAALPIEPQVGVDSFALTKAFLVSPGDTAPSNIITSTIYDENTEWVTGTQSNTSTVDFDNIDNPLHLTKDIFISKYNNNSQLYFVNGSYVSTENTPQSVLLLPIYLNAALSASNNIYISLYDTLTSSTNLYRLGSNDNFNKNEANAYQTVVIPTSNFTWINNKSTFTTLLVTFTGYDTSGAKGLYMDYIRLQKGLFQTGNGSCPLCIVDIHVTEDSMYQVSIRQNGDTASVIPFGNNIDTTSLSDRINEKLNISDTASMLLPYLRKNAISAGTNISFTGTGTDADPIVINSSGGGGVGGISQLGSPAYGLTRLNDSTYITDTSVLAGLYPRIKDSTIAFATPQQVHDSILSNKVTVIAKSPVVIYKKMGGDLYDSIGIRQASSTDSGYLSKEDWDRFNRNSKDTSRIIRKDSLGITPTANFPFSSYIGLVLANYYQSVGSGTESSPAISMRGSWTHAVTGYHPAWIQMYVTGSSAGGLLNIRTSEDSSSWTNLLTMSLAGATFTPPVSSQSFTASTGISVTNLFNSNVGHHSILFGAGSGNYANPFSLVEIKDTTTGFIINRGSTLARLKLGTSPFAATITSGGSGYTGTIFNSSFITGGSGSGSVQISGTISGGVITSITGFSKNGGSGYRIGDTISANIPGGTGFKAVITKLQGDTACGLQFYDTTLNRLYVWNCTNHYWDAIGPNQHSILTPTTGGTINVVRDLEYIINPAGTIAELTIALPSTPNNNDKVYLKFSQAVTAITYSGGTVVGIPTTATAGQQFYLTYDLTTNTWY